MGEKQAYLVKQYLQREKKLSSAEARFEEDLLDIIVDPDLSQEAKREIMMKFVQEMTLRMHFYTNSPLKSIIELRMDDPALKDWFEQGVDLLMDLALEGAEDAMTKSLVFTHPGG